MKNSQAFIEFTRKLETEDKGPLFVYDPFLFDKIYPEERDEIEDAIWENFVNGNDTALSHLMTLLKNHDGKEALEDKLRTLSIPSLKNADVAAALYECTKDGEYLGFIIRDYEGVEDRTPIVARLVVLSRDDCDGQIYSLLKEIYINDESFTNRSHALVGVMGRDDVIKSVEEVGKEEFDRRMRFLRRFELDDREERERVLTEYLEGRLRVEDEGPEPPEEPAPKKKRGRKKKKTLRPETDGG